MSVGSVNKKTALFIWRSVLFVFCLVLWSSACYGYAHGTEKSVLVLHSYHKGLAWTDTISEGVEQALLSNEGKIELTFEFMDTKRSFDKKYLTKLRELYHLKYAHRKFDAIISSDDHAFQFLRAHHKKLFADTPVVFCGVNSFEDSMLKEHPLITGVLEACDIQKSIESALELQPEIKTFYVLVDHTVSGQANKKLLEKTVPTFSGRVEFKYLENLTMLEALSRVSNLPPDSATIILNFTADREGNYFSFQKSVQLLSSASNVPMYSFWDFYMGHGIVGGRLTSGVHQGRKAAEIVLEIFNSSLSEIPPVLKESPNHYIFDYRQLKRFNIPLAKLPDNSIVINQSVSFFAQHKKLILGVIGGFIFLSVVIAVLIANIFSRQRAENALRKSEEYYRQFFEGDLSAVYISRPDGELVTCNRVFADMFGFNDITHVRQVNMTSYYTRSDERERFMEHLKKYKKLEHYELVLKKSDGTPLSVLINAIGRFDDDGELYEILGYIMDMTSQKNLEKKLLQAQKMESIGTMAGGVAHDFNNLLMGIQGNVSLIQMNCEINDGSELDIRLENINRFIDSGADLTRQLLGFAKGGKYEVKSSDLNELIDHNATMFGRTKKGIKIHKEFASDLWIVDIDRSQIDQVFYNLYLNADYAMSGRGDLYLQSQNTVVDKQIAKIHKVEAGRFVKVSVSDTGVGMNEATVKRIFDPFFTTKEMGHGTGLGLASVYGIIQNHGGFVTVLSMLGQGTSFNIFLPASGPEVYIERDEYIQQELYKGSETILLVDDEEHILEISAEMLSQLGYNVLSARGGKAAVSLYEEHKDKIDIVILDLIMPEFDGQQTFEALKKINSGVMVLLSSGYSMNDQAETIMNQGCLGFLQKPYNIWEFSKKVREVLNPH